MNVLVVGSGGREHALIWKLAQSNLIQSLFCAPGNPGVAKFAENVPLAVDDVDGLAAFAKEKNIHLTVVGPEYPLSLGLVDRFQAAGLCVFGPGKEAARLESSKAFAKDVMVQAGVPTAGYQEFSSKQDALEYLETQSGPIVVKADGLAAGKGVFVCADRNEAIAAVNQLFEDPDFTKVVIEDFLEGVEASFIRFSILSRSWHRMGYGAIFFQLDQYFTSSFGRFARS